MADITMCTGEEASKGVCPMRDSCYRHNAQRSSRQSWFMTIPLDWVDDATDKPHCDHYWKVQQ